MRFLLLCAVLAVAGCGDKVPESEAARRVGNIPKQTIDNVSNKVQDAMKQGQESERLKDAENK
ncbi:MAG TPA: hypothetical protein VEU32_04300 [Burkholderiales bacterium]|nr:hypothetical protein [Burkholderiales bacterium]